MAQKFAHAWDLRDQLGVEQPILLDALYGACRRAYGSMPNTTWIFARSGVPIYKSDWIDAHSVENALRCFLSVTKRRRQGERLAPFHVERLDFRTVDREGFFEGLARSGPKAVREFRETFGQPDT